MNGLTQRQRVKVNAALSIIHDHGYNASAVSAWAKEYRDKQGYPVAKAYERALNEFIGGQPVLSDALHKVTRLVQASDDATVASYDKALTTYIQTGDDSGIAALSSTIAQDSVALAVRHGEIKGGVTAENVEAALGLAMADQHVPQAPPASFNVSKAVEAQQAKAEAPQDKAPAVFQGYVGKAAQERWAGSVNLQAGEPRSMLDGHQVGGVVGANPAQTN